MPSMHTPQVPVCARCAPVAVWTKANGRVRQCRAMRALELAGGGAAQAHTLTARRRHTEERETEEESGVGVVLVTAFRERGNG